MSVSNILFHCEVVWTLLPSTMTFTDLVLHRAANHCHVHKITLDISFYLSPFLSASSSLALLIHTFICTGNLGSLKYLIEKVIMSFSSQGILWVKKCYFNFCALTLLVWDSRTLSSRILKRETGKSIDRRTRG